MVGVKKNFQVKKEILRFFFINFCFFIQVNLNYFAEKHGKNSRDAHFSCISKFVQAASLRERLTCSDDIVDAIEEGQRRANQNSNCFN